MGLDFTRCDRGAGGEADEAAEKGGLRAPRLGGGRNAVNDARCRPRGRSDGGAGEFEVVDEDAYEGWTQWRHWPCRLKWKKMMLEWG
jgi:hypothetical protein